MSPTTQNRVLVVLPTYNERENIAAIVPQILTQAKEIDILIVDDNSPDGTGQIADGMAANNQRINVLHREKKAGLGRAYIAGFKWGLQPGTPYEFLIEMDADLSHNPNDLNALIAKARLPHVDIAIGSRYCRWEPASMCALSPACRSPIPRGDSNASNVPRSQPSGSTPSNPMATPSKSN